MGCGRSTARSPDLELVGEAATGTEAVARAEETLPDVILMDIRMPGMTGIEATRADPRCAGRETRILILTMSEDDDSLFAAMRAGARGYLPKDADSEDLIRAIRAAALGEVIFGESIATRLQAFFAAGARARRRAVPRADGPGGRGPRADRPGPLEPRRSPPSSEISDKTVRNHVANVFNKLRVADRGQAIIRAREAGLGRDGRSRAGLIRPNTLPGRPGHAPDVPGTSAARYRSQVADERPVEGRIPWNPRYRRSQRSVERIPIGSWNSGTPSIRPALERYVRSLVRDPDEAADVCQEAFVRLLLVTRAGRLPDSPLGLAPPRGPQPRRQQRPSAPDERPVHGSAGRARQPAVDRGVDRRAGARSDDRRGPVGRLSRRSDGDAAGRPGLSRPRDRAAPGPVGAGDSNAALPRPRTSPSAHGHLRGGLSR